MYIRKAFNSKLSFTSSSQKFSFSENITVC